MISRIVFGLLFSLAAAGVGAAQTVAPQKPETSTDRTDSHVDMTSTMATVYVYRSPGEESATADKVPVYFDGKQVASVGRGRFFIVFLDPGMHNFGHAPRGRVGTFAGGLKRGQKYYLRIDDKPPAGARVKNGPRFTLTPAEQGASEIGQLTPIEAGDVKDKDHVLTRYPES